MTVVVPSGSFPWGLKTTGSPNANQLKGCAPRIRATVPSALGSIARTSPKKTAPDAGPSVRRTPSRIMKVPAPSGIRAGSSATTRSVHEAASPGGRSIATCVAAGMGAPCASTNNRMATGAPPEKSAEGRRTKLIRGGRERPRSGAWALSQPQAPRSGTGMDSEWNFGLA